MKRNVKQNGSGGRLRLGLLLTTAFLLVPAAQAFAEPELTVNLTGQPGASGEVSSKESVTAEIFEGTPPIECNYPVGGPQGGTCKNTMEKLVGPFTVWLVSMKGLPGPESKNGKWIVSGGEISAGCLKSNEKCIVKTLNENENIEVSHEFENEVTELRLNLIGVEGGGGEVVSPNTVEPFPGTPPLACLLEEGDEGPAEQTGICENEMEGGGGEFAESLEAFPGLNSEIEKWTFVPGHGAAFPGFCGPPQETRCFALSAGEDVELNVYFKCEAGKECPPPPPEFPLEVTTSGTGSGTIECSIDSGPEGACPAEVAEGSDVELIVTEDPGSNLAEWTTGPCEGTAANPCSFTMPAGPVSANAEINVETFALTLNPPIGAGTLAAECDYGSGLEACASLTEIPYNTDVEVTADPDPLNSVLSLTGSNSASGCSIAGVGPEEAATCEFAITADSEVTAEFVGAESIATHPVNVFGEVAQQTTLETEDCDDVDLGPFVPSATEVSYANDECVVTVTATGAENELRAADEEVILPNGTNLTGHLTQEPASPFTLNKALEVKGTGTTGGATPNPSALQPLSSTAILQDYGTPVSLDVVTVEFRQLIEAFEPLHTGTYDKTITLTLEQTVL